MGLELDYSDGDIILIIVFAVIFAAFIIQTFRLLPHHPEYHNPKYRIGNVILILLGIVQVVVGIIGLCISAGRWEIEYILPFILLAGIGQHLFFGRLVLFGYLFILTGIFLLLVLKPKTKLCAPE